MIGKTAGIAASFVGFQPERLSRGAVGRPARCDGHAGGKTVQLVCQHAADVPVADDKAGRAVQPVRAVQHGKGALGCRHGVVRCQRLRAEKLDRLRAAVEQGLPQRAEPAAIDPRTAAAAGEHGGTLRCGGPAQALALQGGKRKNDKVGGSRERLRHAGHAAAADLEPGVQQGLCGPALALVSAEQKAGFGHDSTSYLHPMQFLRFR